MTAAIAKAVAAHFLCRLLRHPLVTIRVYERGHAIVGRRCRCARRVESCRVYPKLHAIRGGRS